MHGPTLRLPAIKSYMNMRHNNERVKNLASIDYLVL